MIDADKLLSLLVKECNYYEQRGTEGSSDEHVYYWQNKMDNINYLISLIVRNSIIEEKEDGN